MKVLFSTPGSYTVICKQNCRNNAEYIHSFPAQAVAMRQTLAVAPHNDPHPPVVIEHQSVMSFVLFLKECNMITGSACKSQ